MAQKRAQSVKARVLSRGVRSRYDLAKTHKKGAACPTLDYFPFHGLAKSVGWLKCRCPSLVVTGTFGWTTVFSQWRSTPLLVRTTLPHSKIIHQGGKWNGRRIQFVRIVSSPFIYSGQITLLSLYLSYLSILVIHGLSPSKERRWEDWVVVGGSEPCQDCKQFSGPRKNFAICPLLSPLIYFHLMRAF